MYEVTSLQVPSSANGVQKRSRAKRQEGEITKSKDLVSDNVLQCYEL